MNNKKPIVYIIFIITGILALLTITISFSQVTDTDGIYNLMTNETYCAGLQLRPIHFSLASSGDTVSCAWPWHRSFVRIGYLLGSLITLTCIFYSIKKNNSLHFISFSVALMAIGILGLYSFISDFKIVDLMRDFCIGILEKAGIAKCTFKSIITTVVLNILSGIMFVIVSIVSIIMHKSFINVNNNTSNNNNNNNNNSSSNRNNNNNSSLNNSTSSINNNRNSFNNNNNNISNNNFKSNSKNKGFFKLEEDAYPNYSLSSTQSI